MTYIFKDEFPSRTERCNLTACSLCAYVPNSDMAGEFVDCQEQKF